MISLTVVHPDRTMKQRLYYEWRDSTTLIKDYVEFDTDDVEGCAHALQTLGARLLEVAGLE